MKKNLAVLTAFLICLLMPMCTYASQSGFETTVPKTHTVSIEAEHASALYIDGDKGLSTAYPVPRLSQPQFQITADEGYVIKRVLLNGEDVTGKMVNGILKLPEVYENQVIVVETKVIGEKPEEPTTDSEEPTTAPVKPSPDPVKPTTAPVTPPTEPVTQPESVTSMTQPESTAVQPESETPAKETQSETIAQTENGDLADRDEAEHGRFGNLWWIVLLLLVLSAGMFFFIIVRKKDKEE